MGSKISQLRAWTTLKFLSRPENLAKQPKAKTLSDTQRDQHILIVFCFPKFPTFISINGQKRTRSETLLRIGKNPKIAKRNLPKLRLFIRKIEIEYYRCKPFGLFDYAILFVLHYYTFWFIYTFCLSILFDWL